MSWVDFQGLRFRGIRGESEIVTHQIVCQVTAHHCHSCAGSPGEFHDSCSIGSGLSGNEFMQWSFPIVERVLVIHGRIKAFDNEVTVGNAKVDQNCPPFACGVWIRLHHSSLRTLQDEISSRWSFVVTSGLQGIDSWILCSKDV